MASRRVAGLLLVGVPVLVVSGAIVATQPWAGPSGRAGNELPAELSVQSWMESEGEVWTVVTLGGGRLGLPEGERPLEANDGLVVSIDVRRPGLDWRHLLVRDLASGDVLVEVDAPALVQAAAIGSRRVYISGPRPNPDGTAVSGEVPGIWELAADGGLTELVEPRTAPAEWTDLLTSRYLTLVPGHPRLLAAICRSGAGQIGDLACDLEVADLETGVLSTTAQGVRGFPLMATNDFAIVQQVLEDRDLVVAIDLDTGRSVWQHEFGNILGGFFDMDGDRLIVGYRPDARAEVNVLATIDLATGRRAEIHRWHPPVGGYFYSSLSAGRFAVFDPVSPESGGTLRGSLLSIFDVDERSFVVEDVPVP